MFLLNRLSWLSLLAGRRPAVAENHHTTNNGRRPRSGSFAASKSAQLNLPLDNGDANNVALWRGQLLDLLETMAPGVKIDGQENSAEHAVFVLSPNVMGILASNFDRLLDAIKALGDRWQVEVNNAGAVSQYQHTLIVTVRGKPYRLSWWEIAKVVVACIVLYWFFYYIWQILSHVS